MSLSKSPTISVQRSDGECNSRASQPRNSNNNTNGGVFNSKAPSLNGTARSINGRLSDTSVNGFSQYSFDVQKYLKELMKKREEIPAARVLPKTHLLAQLVIQEISARELCLVQERSLRQQILHKRDEDRSKKEEQRVQQRSRERLDELKRKQQEEMALKKEVVTNFQKQIDSEVKSKLRIVSLLQPRMNVAAAVLAEIKNEFAHIRLLPELMEEEKRVTKALKADSRLSRGPNDLGAVPHWARTCVASSFNISAIMQEIPLRAAVEDAIKVPNAALRKLLVVRHADRNGAVVAWLHVRAGADPMALAAEIAQLPAPEELAAKLSVGVVWPKEDWADLNRKARAAGDADIMSVVGVSTATLTFEGVTTFEFTKKDIENIGQLASA